MTVALASPAAQACAFVLGCAVIHAARAHAERLPRLLMPVVIGVSVPLPPVASLAYAPGAGETVDAVSVNAAS